MKYNIYFELAAAALLVVLNLYVCNIRRIRQATGISSGSQECCSLQ